MVALVTIVVMLAVVAGVMLVQGYYCALFTSVARVDSVTLQRTQAGVVLPRTSMF